MSPRARLSPERRFATRLWPVLLALFCALPAPGRANGTGTPPRLGAWLTSWDLARGLERVELTPRPPDDVLLFLASLDPGGSPHLDVSDAAFTQTVTRIRARGALVWLTVVNDVRAARGLTLKDRTVVHRILGDPGHREAHAREIVRLAQGHGLVGVDLDYENLDPEDREGFTAFVAELAAQLHARGMQLSVTVQPKVGESRSRGPGAADWAALSRQADRLQIMLYNLHSGRSGPGPIATPGWVQQVMRFAETQCDRARLVPILKVSGMDWGPAEATGVQYEKALELAQQHGAPIQREPETGVPHFGYSTETGPHAVYFEDATSILRKVQALETLGYRDVVVWSLGREDPLLLPTLQAP